MLWLLWIGRTRECSAHHTNNAMCCKHIGRRWKSASEKSFVGKMRRKQPKIEFNGGTTIIGTNALCTKHYTRECALSSVFSSAVEKWYIIFVACMNCAMVDENMVEKEEAENRWWKKKNVLSWCAFGMFCHSTIHLHQVARVCCESFNTIANLSIDSLFSRA